MNNINYLCCRWRYAITDPPPENWVGLATEQAGRKWVSCGPDRRLQPGDQWLDVTDTPAVPRAGVQAAVDEMVSRYWHGVNCIINGDSSQCEECAFDKYPLPLCKSLACIEHFTGITPTVEP